jgi:hypothetical protein
MESLGDIGVIGDNVGGLTGIPGEVIEGGLWGGPSFGGIRGLCGGNIFPLSLADSDTSAGLLEHERKAIWIVTDKGLEGIAAIGSIVFGEMNFQKSGEGGDKVDLVDEGR